MSEKEKDPIVANGLTEAIMGWNPGSTGSQLSQVDTIFKNNRWYMISNMRQVLSQIYVEHGLIQAVVDVPVDDAFRGGIEIKTKQLSTEEIEELNTEIERQGIMNEVVGQAIKWNRLFGGAGILIMTDQDPSTPLDIKTIKEDTPLEFRAVDMWELFADSLNTVGDIIKPAHDAVEFYSYYGVRVHKSRVLRLKGLQAPSFIRPRLRGWGFSIVESIIRSINQYLKSNELTFEVLDEFKLDIFKIKNLTQTLLNANGTEQVQKRIALANHQKNYQNAITMDAEDDYQQKQLGFAGISELMREFRVQIASDLRMPMTKIFGISSAGFNSGEDDIENYNAMVESQVRSKCKYEIIEIIKILCAKKFGTVPDDFSIGFKPLRVLSSEQEQNVKNAELARIESALRIGACTIKEAKEAINKNNLLPIQVDMSIDSAPMSGEGVEEEKKIAAGKREPKKAEEAESPKEPE